MPLFIHVWDVRRMFPVARVLRLLAPGQYPGWAPEAGKGPCPICTRTGKNRWFRYTAERWECVRCKRSGDCLDLADWLLKDWTRHPAEALCRAAGVRVPTFDEPTRKYPTWIPLAGEEAKGST